MSQPMDGRSEGGFGSGLASRLGNAWRAEGREPGARRAKLMGYISGIKDAYDQKYAGFGSSFRPMDEYQGGLAEAYPDAHISRSDDEEMIVFPSYSRRHIAKKGRDDGDQDPNTTENSDVNASQAGAQAGAQAVQQHWDKYEDQNAVVDIDVRGWIYTPHKGQMNRKQRLALGIARQLAGLPAPAASASPSKTPEDSRSTSPHPLRDRIEEHHARKEQRLIEEETQNMLSHAQDEAEKAERGEYSENNGLRPSVSRISRLKSEDSVDTITMAQKRASWNIPSEMSQDELTLANTNLMSRLRAFYANPLANAPVSAFFYNDTDSRQRTIYTNNYGQFALRAALDFVPTHVRILASENLSATQEIKISDPSGVSVISDIDDTIKHTGMLTGAREAFRNAFLRDLDDLVIDGVHEWYTRLAEMGVQFHYVSNSPWQLFPALSRFFTSVGLPPGSFHLKQYSGMLQGIFEPVAERKKSTLDRIARDFPERHFILVGDSGEADLEVYMDFVRENPGRVLGIYIRDVTTPETKGSVGFFDQNIQSTTSANNNTARDSTVERKDHAAMDDEHDPELKAAIQASLKEFEAEEARRKGRSSSSVSKTEPSISRLDSEDLISFSDSDSETKSKAPPKPPPRRRALESKSETAMVTRKAPPPRPTKPDSMRSSSTQSDRTTEQPMARKAPPPLPPKKSATLSISSSNGDVNPTAESKPSHSVPSRRAVSGANAKPDSLSSSDDLASKDEKSCVATVISSAYNALPSAPWTAEHQSSKPSSATSSTAEPSNDTEREKPPPLPTRRSVASYPVAAAQYASSRVSSAINSYYGNDNSSNNNGNSGTATPPANNGLTRAQNNRIELWKRRWAGAEAYLKKQNVVLRTWRVGTDAIEDSVRLVERARRERPDVHE